MIAWLTGTDKPSSGPTPARTVTSLLDDDAPPSPSIPNTKWAGSPTARSPTGMLAATANGKICQTMSTSETSKGHTPIASKGPTPPAISKGPTPKLKGTNTFAMLEDSDCDEEPIEIGPRRGAPVKKRTVDMDVSKSSSKEEAPRSGYAAKREELQQEAPRSSYAAKRIELLKQNVLEKEQEAKIEISANDWNAPLDLEKAVTPGQKRYSPPAKDSPNGTRLHKVKSSGADTPRTAALNKPVSRPRKATDELDVHRKGTADSASSSPNVDDAAIAASAVSPLAVFDDPAARKASAKKRTKSEPTERALPANPSSATEVPPLNMQRRANTNPAKQPTKRLPGDPLPRRANTNPARQPTKRPPQPVRSRSAATAGRSAPKSPRPQPIQEEPAASDLAPFFLASAPDKDLRGCIDLVVAYGGFYAAGDKDDIFNKDVLVGPDADKEKAESWKVGWKGKVEMCFNMLKQMNPEKDVIAIAIAGGPACDWERAELRNRFCKVHKEMQLKVVGDSEDLDAWLQRQGYQKKPASYAHKKVQDRVSQVGR